MSVYYSWVDISQISQYIANIDIISIVSYLTLEIDFFDISISYQRQVKYR